MLGQALQGAFELADAARPSAVEPQNATEHLLQVCDSAVRPDEDVHIGTLVTVAACGLRFDLVAKQRVEG